MKREMDLVREILLAFEANDKPRMSAKTLQIEGRTEEQVLFHIELMKEAGLLDHQIVRPQFRGRNGMDVSSVGFDMGIRPTMKGYELLDSIRDPEVWRRTKDASARVGVAGVEFIWEIAKGIGKQIIKEKLGIDIA